MHARQEIASSTQRPLGRHLCPNTGCHFALLKAIDMLCSSIKPRLCVHYGIVPILFGTMSTQEAALQCIDAVKNRSRAASTRSAEAAASTISPSHFRPQKRVSKNKLYDIEVVAENGSQVKVHYCGYGSEFDEWKPRSEVMYTKPAFLPTSSTHP